MEGVLFAKKNPFRVVHQIIDDKTEYYFLNGDPCTNPESWKGKDLFATNISFAPEDNKENVRESRLQDLKEDYTRATETDGSKVDWNVLELTSS